MSAETISSGSQEFTQSGQLEALPTVDNSLTPEEIKAGEEREERLAAMRAAGEEYDTAIIEARQRLENTDQEAPKQGE
jgi:hypothetical protein